MSIDLCIFYFAVVRACANFACLHIVLFVVNPGVRACVFVYDHFCEILCDPDVFMCEIFQLTVSVCAGLSSFSKTCVWLFAWGWWCVWCCVFVW